MMLKASEAHLGVITNKELWREFQEHGIPKRKTWAVNKYIS